MRGSIAVLTVFLAISPLSFVSADYDDWYDSRNNPHIDALGSTPILSLPIPVLFGVDVDDLTENFGDPRGDGTRTHEGLDMHAPMGTPVASPTDAVVVRVGDGPDSGLYVRTANPGGEQFVFMHLSAIASGINSGTSVKKGEIIGFVGNTGNAINAGAHLHFEIRKNGATDPFPRLTHTFTRAEAEESISAAQARGVVIPASALAAFNKVPASVSATTAPALSGTAAQANLVFNKTNADVTALQRFLILSPKGPVGQRLANTGATGYFGPLTRDALIEYQRSAGLSATGMVDAATYQRIFAQTGAATTPPSSSASGAFARDLDIGAAGEDVRALQVFLNTHSAIIATSGAGSPGNETAYFGALTQKALARYQAANGITPAAGYFGPKTRAAILRI